MSTKTTKTVAHWKTRGPANLRMVASVLHGACCGRTGATVDERGNPVDPAGYAVGRAGHELRTSYPPRFGTILQWCQDVFQPGVKFGAWYDADAGHWYLDVSDVVADREDAVKLGRERKQLAVYSFASGESITL